ncbi:IS200/IS605 family transposase [Salinimicrobium xinjiangense]|uniref:IS200/IS605 family transposase n=1 Tax=Salinimicrobium xinjiangense TaxID=438596 RepID=UPI0003F9A734|nr:IS200/IS605 family transposase [Salinimicrobium xinjiangense]
MPNTFTQIHIHFVFAVKFREALIQPHWKERLYQYITAIVQDYGHKMLIINGMSDHVHFLIGLRPNQSISDLMQDVKGGSSKWINEEKLVNGRFAWQEGYGAFSYSKSQVPGLINYIQNQQEHHRKMTFQEEYVQLLEELKIPFDPKYIFKDLS